MAMRIFSTHTHTRTHTHTHTHTHIYIYTQTHLEAVLLQLVPRLVVLGLAAGPEAILAQISRAVNAAISGY